MGAITLVYRDGYMMVPRVNVKEYFNTHHNLKHPILCLLSNSCGDHDANNCFPNNHQNDNNELFLMQ